MSVNHKPQKSVVFGEADGKTESLMGNDNLDMVENHDAHVQAAHKLFRDCGFTLAAMAYKRPPEALAALRAFNKAPEGWQHPFAWGYHPNEWCARRWAETGRLV